VVAIGMASGLAFYPEAELEAISRVVLIIGLFGVGLMISAMVFGAPWLVGWATVTLLAEYGLSLVARPSVDPRAPLYAAVLFLTVESAYASLERQARIAGLSGRFVGHVARWVVFGVSALAVAALVLTLASLPVAHGILVQVAGVAAAAAVLATLIFLVRQRA
jgi:hypothetical protein